jgi:acetoin utilization protein AcuC
MPATTGLVAGESIARYGFSNGHPFGPDRHDAFMQELRGAGLLARVLPLTPRAAARDELEMFHTAAYLDAVKARTAAGQGFLDAGDTPAQRGMYEVASQVVGATLVAAEAILQGRVRRAFVPIAGLHHARRDAAAGFCVFNDCGVLIEWLFRRHGLARVAYVDIDAHHGDGVFYGFESDPRVIIADLHEDGRTLYPGTGAAEETGTQQALGTKLNLPLAAGAGDAEFHEAWAAVERHLAAFPPDFILLQAGADSLRGDPITHLEFSEDAHAHAATRLAALADEYCGGRLLATGGGGYNRRNLARAWTRVVGALCDAG